MVADAVWRNKVQYIAQGANKNIFAHKETTDAFPQWIQVMSTSLSRNFKGKYGTQRTCRYMWIKFSEKTQIVFV